MLTAYKEFNLELKGMKPARSYGALKTEINKFVGPSKSWHVSDRIRHRSTQVDTAECGQTRGFANNNNYTWDQKGWFSSCLGDSEQ